MLLIPVLINNLRKIQSSDIAKKTIKTRRMAKQLVTNLTKAIMI